MIEATPAIRAHWLNLLVPGGGLIWIGAVWQGLTIGLLFSLTMGAALAGSLVIPDDVPRSILLAVLVAAVVTYLVAQLRLDRLIRWERRQTDQRTRQEALAQAQAHLERGEPDAALQALSSVRELAELDLLVAYRLAQALSQSGDADEARAAWQRVRRLDRHRLYRAEADAGLRSLSVVQSSRQGFRPHDA